MRNISDVLKERKSALLLEAQRQLVQLMQVEPRTHLLNALDQIQKLITYLANYTVVPHATVLPAVVDKQIISDLITAFLPLLREAESIYKMLLQLYDKIIEFDKNSNGPSLHDFQKIEIIKKIDFMICAVSDPLSFVWSIAALKKMHDVTIDFETEISSMLIGNRNRDLIFTLIKHNCPQLRIKYQNALSQFIDRFNIIVDDVKIKNVTFAQCEQWIQAIQIEFVTKTLAANIQQQVDAQTSRLQAMLPTSAQTKTSMETSQNGDMEMKVMSNAQQQLPVVVNQSGVEITPQVNRLIEVLRDVLPRVDLTQLSQLTGEDKDLAETPPEIIVFQQNKSFFPTALSAPPLKPSSQASSLLSANLPLSVPLLSPNQAVHKPVAAQPLIVTENKRVEDEMFSLFQEIDEESIEKAKRDHDAQKINPSTLQNNIRHTLMPPPTEQSLLSSNAPDRMEHLHPIQNADQSNSRPLK